MRLIEVIAMGLFHPDTILFYGYEFLSAFLPFFLVFLLLGRFSARRGRPLTKAACVCLLLFAVYVIGVYHFTGAATLFEARRFGLDLQTGFHVLPFSQPVDGAGYLLNVVLFVPLGLLAPLIWEELRGPLPVMGFGAAFSLFIEATQLWNVRATDIDDLIMNLLGTMLGFGIYRLSDRAAGAGLARRSSLGWAAVCILLPFLGRFLLYDEMGLARLLYDF